MDCVSCLKHLILDCEFGCGVFLFGSFSQVSKILGLFLLLALGLNILSSGRFSRCLIRYLRGKSGELKHGLCFLNGKNLLLESMEMSSYEPSTDKIGEPMEGLNRSNDSDEDTNVDCENFGDKLTARPSSKSDFSTLKRRIKIERQRANAARAELARERASSATAAEEAMAMILRLQNDKSLIELESSQYKRLAEEKQIHDQEVIRSLQWLVWRHESERTLLQDQLKLCRQQLNQRSWDESKPEEQVEEAQSSFNDRNNIWDALENVLYSSREATLSSPPPDQVCSAQSIFILDSNGGGSMK